MGFEFSGFRMKSLMAWMIFAQLVVSGLGFITLAILHAPWWLTVWAGIVFIVSVLNVVFKIIDLRDKSDTLK